MCGIEERIENASITTERGMAVDENGYARIIAADAEDGPEKEKKSSEKGTVGVLPSQIIQDDKAPGNR